MAAADFGGIEGAGGRRAFADDQILRRIICGSSKFRRRRLLPIAFAVAASLGLGARTLA
jgi:hypothetical protein